MDKFEHDKRADMGIYDDVGIRGDDGVEMILENYELPYLTIEYSGDFPPQDYEKHIVSIKFINPNNPDRNFNCENAFMRRERSADFYIYRSKRMEV